MAVFHHLGEVVDLLLDDVGLFQRLHLLIPVGGAYIVIQLMYEDFQLAYLIESIVRESLLAFLKRICIFCNILGIVTDALKVTDCPVGGGQIQVVMLTEASPFRKTHDEIDKCAVDEVYLLLNLVKQSTLLEILRGDDAECRFRPEWSGLQRQ